MIDANKEKLTSVHFYAWQLGLKTGCYYLRTQAAVDPIKFTIDLQKLGLNTQKKTEIKDALKNLSIHIPSLNTNDNFGKVEKEQFNPSPESPKDNANMDKYLNMIGDSCKIDCDSCGS